MSDPIDDYLASLRHELRGVPDADDIVSEMEDHLREAADVAASTGSPTQLAARVAVQRFGRPGQVARSVGAAQLQPSDRDPAPVRPWVFGLTEGLLILAALSAATAIHLHWLPCGGDATAPMRIHDACLARMDTGWAFPFAPEASERSPATDGFRLAGLLLLALAWSVFSLCHPWRRRVRWVIALPALPLLAMAADTAWLMTAPAAESQWWAENAPAALDLFTLASIATIVLAAAPLGERVAAADRAAGPPPISYGSFRWRGVLLLMAVSAPSFLRAAVEYFTMAGFSEPNWDTPPGTGYLTAISIAAFAIGSLLTGRFARPPEVFGEDTDRSHPEAATPAISGCAR